MMMVRQGRDNKDNERRPKKEKRSKGKAHRRRINMTRGGREAVKRMERER